MLCPEMPIAIIRAIEAPQANYAAVRLILCMSRLVVAIDILFLYRIVRAVRYAAAVANDLGIVLALNVAAVTCQYPKRKLEKHEVLLAILAGICTCE
jgi:hypothetical protein